MRAEEFIFEHAVQDYSEYSREFNGLDMSVQLNNRTGNLTVMAYDDGQLLGQVLFKLHGGTKLYPWQLEVQPQFRGKGVAKTMYDFVKGEGFTIHRSTYQTDAGSGFWDKHRGKSSTVWEDELDEAPLPADWEPAQFHNPSTTFKSRLAYALERAKKLGTGSSRVAMTIEFEGRPTVLKVAKNQKGLAQNEVEASILSDGYASQMGIMIPIIDYDEQNTLPTWIHTELAQKANEKQLCNLMQCDSLDTLVQTALTLIGKSRMTSYTPQNTEQRMREAGKTDEQIEVFMDYVNKLGDLSSSFDVELADFMRPANWGIYQGRPVVIDVGFNSSVMKQYYR